MTFGTTPPLIDYVENAVTLIHAIPFQFEVAGDIVCSRIDPTSLVETELVNGTHYSLTGGGGGTGTVTKTSGGTVGIIFRIRRRTGRDQAAPFAAHDDFPAQNMGLSLDRLAAVDQEQDQDHALLEAAALRAPKSDFIPALPAPVSRVSKFMQWANDGKSLLLLSTGQMAAAIATQLAVLLPAFKGDPGGNAMAIGLKVAAAALLIPGGTDLVQTSGYDAVGKGHARYAYDAAVDAAYVATHPLTSFVAGNGRGFKLAEQLPDVAQAGVAGDGASDDSAALDAAVAALAAAGFSNISVAPKTYLLNSTHTISANGITLHARGATFTSPLTTSNPVIRVAGAGVAINGLRLYLSDITSTGWTVDVTGTDCRLEFCTLEAIEGSAGILAFVRQGADGFRFIGSTLRGGLGIQQEGSDFAYLNSQFYSRGTTWGTDDAIAVKASGLSTINGRVEGCFFRDFYAMLSIGTQIGTAAANDPNHSIICGNIVGEGNVGHRCVTQLYIKPGDGTSDRRDGGVVGIGWSNNSLYDPYGERFRSGVIIVPSRGCYVKGVHGKNNAVIARGVLGDVTGQRSGAHDIRIDNSSTAGSVPSDISDVDVEVNYTDPFKGYANGTVITALGTAGPDPYGIYGVGATVPGQPVLNISSVILSDTAYGTMSGIVLTCTGDGCDASGIKVGANLDDAVFIKKAHLNNVCRTGTASTRAGVDTSSRITVSTDISITQTVGHPYWPRSGTTGDVICPELSDQIYIGSSLAGDVVTRAPWQAKRRCALLELRIDTSNAVAQDVTNNVQLAFLNLDTTGTSFGNWSNNTTGATASRKRSALAANAYTPMWLLKDVTTDADKTQAQFALDARLQVARTIAGTGTAFSDTRMIVRAAPY